MRYLNPRPLDFTRALQSEFDMPGGGYFEGTASADLFRWTLDDPYNRTPHVIVGGGGNDHFVTAPDQPAGVAGYGNLYYGGFSKQATHHTVTDALTWEPWRGGYDTYDIGPGDRVKPSWQGGEVYLHGARYSYFAEVFVGMPDLTIDMAGGEKLDDAVVRPFRTFSGTTERIADDGDGFRFKTQVHSVYVENVTDNPAISGQRLKANFTDVRSGGGPDGVGDVNGHEYPWEATYIEHRHEAGPTDREIDLWLRDAMPGGDTGAEWLL